MKDNYAVDWKRWTCLILRIMIVFLVVCMIADQYDLNARYLSLYPLKDNTSYGDADLIFRISPYLIYISLINLIRQKIKIQSAALVELKYHEIDLMFVNTKLVVWTAVLIVWFALWVQSVSVGAYLPPHEWSELPGSLIVIYAGHLIVLVYFVELMVHSWQRLTRYWTTDIPIVGKLVLSLIAILFSGVERNRTVRGKLFWIIKCGVVVYILTSAIIDPQQYAHTAIRSAFNPVTYVCDAIAYAPYTMFSVVSALLLTNYILIETDE